MVLGISFVRYRLIAIAIAAFISAAAGTLYAQYVLYLDPESVLILPISVQVVLVAMLGGAGSILGPALGALILVPHLRDHPREDGPQRHRRRHDGLRRPHHGSSRSTSRRGCGGCSPGSRRAVRRPPRRPPRRGSRSHERAAPRGPRRHEAVRRPRRERRRLLRRERGGDRQHHRPERRREDHALRLHHRASTARARDQVTFRGRDVTGWKADRICRLGIARTFQIVQVIADMTVLENVMTGAFLRAARARPAAARRARPSSSARASATAGTSSPPP